MNPQKLIGVGVLTLVCSCAPPASSPPGDRWGAKIRGWQQRAQTAEVSQPSPLGTEMTQFEIQTRRMLAREVIRWVQDTSLQYYRDDGPVDHWATLGETLETNGDDCDGLELLTLHLLRRLGFPRGDLFRAIVRNRREDLYHMVTLWFEDPEDPWVLDPTGATTQKMVHLTQLRGWEVERVFDEERYFGGE